MLDFRGERGGKYPGASSTPLVPSSPFTIPFTITVPRYRLVLRLLDIRLRKNFPKKRLSDLTTGILWDIITPDASNVGGS